MATPVAMPRQGNTVESCVITEWHKKKGDVVKQGEVLFSFETDKASFEFEAPAAGTVLDIFFDTGIDIPVLTNVAVIGKPGEDAGAYKPSASTPAPATVAPGAAEPHKPAAQSAPAPAPSAQPDSARPDGWDRDRPMASPRARGLASEKGVGLESLKGTGPGGRIIERDVAAAAAAAPLTPSAAAARTPGTPLPARGSGIGGRVTLADVLSAPQAGTPAAAALPADEVTPVKMSKIRSIIAARMVQSLHEAAQLTLNTGADVSGLLAYRQRVKKQREALKIADINITDMIACALARTLVRFPDVNALLAGDTIHQYKHVHLALAVDTPRGLMVPVVRYADLLSLSDLSTALKTVAAQCVEGSINPDMLSGGTITLSNVGTFGVESFTPIINPPQVAILGVNTISPRPVATDKGDYVMKPHIGLSLTIDHRAIDGAPAARFLKALVTAIENFDLTLAV